MKQVAIGIDIGGTNTEIAFVDKQGQIIKREWVATDKHEEFELYIKDLHQAIDKMMAKTNGSVELKGIGIGAPNGNYYNGSIEYAPNLKWKGVINLVEIFNKHYNLPSVLTNDANAAAIGEMMFGAAKGMSDFIVITLGTGLGSGIVSNGNVIYGHDGLAGEMGHTVIKPNGRYCRCGLQGCLETYVSASGIKRTVFKLLADHYQDSELRDVPFNKLTAKMISEAAHRGDIIAKEAFEYTGRILGNKLAEATAYTSPEAYFLFGGLAQAGELIFEPTRRFMEENMLNLYRGKVKVLPSGLPGAEAAVLGASALAFKEFCQ